MSNEKIQAGLEKYNASVEKTGDFSADGAKYVGTFKILKQILEYDYLWTNIRVL